jgi:hypothetical protein
MYGLSEGEVRDRFPVIYQWLLERVKPERDQNNRESRRRNWWLFGETNPKLRRQLAGLLRFVATVETAKHRVFQFVDGAVLPDNKLVSIALPDGFHLGVLSSCVHGAWALAAGSWLGVGNDPVYVKSRCFEAFPFPDIDPTGPLADRIRTLAEQIDAHRKTQLAAHPDATITATYNVLEKLRRGEALTPKEKLVHEHGLVGVLKSLHDELDAAVLQAYGWADLSLPADTDALLVRLVELNAQRAAEEAAGTVRWLRPDFQQAGHGQQATLETDTDTDDNDAKGEDETAEAKPTQAAIVQRPWPTGLTEQIKAVVEVLASAGRSLDLEDLAAHFSARGRWRDRLPMLLDTLVALGRARVVAGGRWIAAGA